MARFRRAALFAAALSAGCAYAVREGKREYFAIESRLRRADVEIVLDRAFIDRYKNRATIETSFTVDRAGRDAHAGYLDGDLHVAGHAAEIGLPIVAEVANAASRPDAIETVHRMAGTGEPIRLDGAWRIWSEHVGKGEQAQGETLTPIERTNPPHVFEVHPVTRLDELDLTGTFHPVPGFRPEPGTTVFDSLKDARLRIVPSENSITLYTRRQELNDAEFTIEVGSDPPIVAPDGRFVVARVLSPRGEQVAERIRMVFVAGPAPEKVARNLVAGDRLRVFGIPRIDLSAVAWRADRADAEPQALDGKLPYEIVVVGIFPEREKPAPAAAGPKASSSARPRSPAVGAPFGSGPVSLSAVP
ncbi:MAG TPA: hypothetical protein VFL12_01300 [Thermoanaerobaculia bacterium]|nr:hypothetical protein [Thermoanaerobaculia bacterium]